MDLKYHTQFLLDKEKGKDNAKLRFRVKWNGNIVAFSLGYRIYLNKWSKDTQRCKANTTHGKKKVSASIINRKIQKYADACDACFKKFEVDDIIPDKNEFREAFNIEIGNKINKVLKEKDKSLFEYYDQFIEEESRIYQWTIRYENKVRNVRNKFYSFNKNLTLNQISEDKLIDFQYYLQDDLKFKNSTILKMFSRLRRFFRWGMKKGYHSNNAFEFFKPILKTSKKKIIFLNQNELKTLREFSIPENKAHLEKVRDFFLFQCYTGLRYSDAANLKQSDIKEEHIEVNILKTTDRLNIDLNSHSKAILEKYKDIHLYENKVFSIISNQKMNDQLKELAEMAGIDETVRQTYYIGKKRFDEITPKFSVLSSHAGRRTFICNALAAGISPQVIMKWTGHSDYKAMKPYIDVADEVKVSAMERFNKFME